MSGTKTRSIADQPATRDAESTVAAAVLALIDVLERESDALAAMNLEAAAALLAEKQRAAETLDQLRAPMDVPPEMLSALREAARTNQTLLERALTVQARVIALVASAHTQRAPRYGACGTIAADRTVAPRALLARA